MRFGLLLIVNFQVGREPRKRAQLRCFAATQLRPLTWLDAPQGQRANAKAHQPQNRMVHRRQHVANLPFFAFAQGNLKPDTLGGPLGKRQFDRQPFHRTHACGCAASLGQWHARAQRLQLAHRRLLINQHKVCLGVFKRRMRQVMREFTVVGEQNQPFAVQVEPTHRKDAAHLLRQQ